MKEIIFFLNENSMLEYNEEIYLERNPNVKEMVRGENIKMENSIMI